MTPREAASSPLPLQCRVSAPLHGLSTSYPRPERMKATAVTKWRGLGGSRKIHASAGLPRAHVPFLPPIDSTKTFGSLSQADVSALCDCEIAAYGGYGTSQTCMCPDGAWQ